MEMLKGIGLKEILAAIAVAMIFLTFIKEFFGISVLGKKIYKGAPIWWKAFIKWATASKTMNDKIDQLLKDVSEIRTQVHYNGGTSMKDAVVRVETNVRELVKIVDAQQKRMEIADVANQRMTFKVNAEAACIEINEVFLKKFGYSEEDVLGYAFEQLVHDDDVHEMRVKWERAINQKGRYYDEQRICDSKGTFHNCCVRGYPLEVNGVLIEFIGYIEILK